MKFLMGFLLSINIFSLSAATMNEQEKILHAVDRLGFGARPGDIEKIKSLQTWINEQLHPDKSKDQLLETKLSGLDISKLSTAELFKKYKKLKDVIKDMGLDPKAITDKKQKRDVMKKVGKGMMPQELHREMMIQKLSRAVESRNQLQEMLVDFWFNHFNVDIHKGDLRWLTPDYEKSVLRPNLFGNFLTLLQATAHSPAMMFYLDNRVSQVNNEKKGKGLNENYAREIMELHTLGVDGGYTQKDVTELARILTGWSIGGESQSDFVFKNKIHDNEAKIFLGETYPAKGAQEEGEKALVVLASHPATAKHISTKLVRYFVDDNPPPALVEKLTKIFLSTKGDLTQVYSVLFNAEEFWDKKYYRVKIKKPFHYVVSAIRALDGEVTLETKLPNFLSDMGEDLYHCPPPTGYKDTAETWVNPGAMVSRMNFALRLSNAQIEGVKIQYPNLAAQTDVNKVIDELSKNILHGTLSANSRSVIEAELKRDNAMMEDGEIRPLSRAKSVALLLSSPEFQRK